MYDMLSYMQKAIRRGKYTDAAFAANEIETTYRRVMWNRLLVITSEDCYGVLTKEVLALKKQDDESRNNQNVARAIALMCKSLKSRDACYFACNFVLCTRKPQDYSITEEDINRMKEILPYTADGPKQYDECGFEQMSIFDFVEEIEEGKEVQQSMEPYESGKGLMIAISHRDMDMIGYYIDMLRREYREYIWQILLYLATNEAEIDILDEISALNEADEIVNRNKTDKDEIFVSKAALILCYVDDNSIDGIESSDMIDVHKLIDWRQYNIKPIEKCYDSRHEIPDWVYDCHTLKGRKMGRTDWDMVVDEQNALHPKKFAYFDNASWLYTFEDDYKQKRISYAGMVPIWNNAKDHEANPVEPIPYE